MDFVSNFTQLNNGIKLRGYIPQCMFFYNLNLLVDNLEEEATTTTTATFSSASYRSSSSNHEHDHAHSFGEHDRDAALRRQFWMIKHGIQASGMPAWGETHTDERSWAMVAFSQKLPELNEMQYRILTAREKSDQGGHH